jgi:NAD(P)-dependent dehydrogenase (short-subunit alcohol dehydrogenase family)
MKGKVVIVTGANGGLGTYVTQAFLEAGATVVGTSRKIRQSDFKNPAFTALPAEISTRQGAKVLVDQVVARFGKLDILAHTVGGFAGGKSIADTDDETFQRMLDLNLNCAFHVLRAALPPLRQTGTGRVIAIGSRAALEPRTWAGRRRIQRFEGGNGLASKDSCAREQRCGADRKRDLARHDGYTGQPESDAECGCEQVGATGHSRGVGSLARQRSWRGRQRVCDPGLR